jgi:hypothetical protein
MRHGLRDDLDADPKKILAKVKAMLSTDKKIDPVK